MPASVASRLSTLVEDEAPGRTRIERLLLVQLAYGSALSGTRPHYEVARYRPRPAWFSGHKNSEQTQRALAYLWADPSAVTLTRTIARALRP